MENCLELPDAVKYSLLKKVRAPIILSFMKIKSNDIILDVGSGGGYFTNILSKKSRMVVGLDMSFINAKNAKQSINMQNVYFVVGDATMLPFKINVFDKILATEIIEHIENDNFFVKECERTLKNKGSIVITTPCTNPTISLDWIRRKSGVNFMTDFGHVRGGYTRNKLQNRLIEANLEIIKVGYFSQFFTELGKIFTYMGRTVQSDGENWTSGKSQAKIVTTKSFKLYKFFFPLLYQFSKLDKLLYIFKGHQDRKSVV